MNDGPVKAAGTEADKFGQLFDIRASERERLFERDNTKLLAELKHRDRPRYEQLIDALRANKVPRLTELDRHVDQVIRNAVKAAAAKKAEQATDDFDRDGKGRILPTQGNIRLAIGKLGVRLRYDKFRGLPIIEGLDGFGPALDDQAMNRLWLSLDSEFGFRPTLQFFQIVASDACLLDQFHPVIEYLDGLKWDGVDRLDTWLHVYCHAEDTPYTRAVGRLMLLAAVRRVRQPGVKFDEMLILESAEGHDKSSMLAELAVVEDWFSDSLPLNVDDKKMIEGHSGKWIIEVAELQGMRKGEVEKIKAQLSRRRDRARMAYGRLPIEVPRQCVFFGTMNPSDGGGYLKSLTGNRRFWPVRVSRIDLKAIKRDRDQLWAEAVDRESVGEGIRLEPALWPAAALEQAEREEVNPLLDLLAKHLSGKEGVLFSIDAWELTRIPVAQRAQHNEKLGKAMRTLGWERRKRRRMSKADQEYAYVRGNESYWLKPVWDTHDQSFYLAQRSFGSGAADSEAPF